jgi:alkylhydroperoxidase family enzyme
MPRIAPLPPKEWPKEYRAAMAALRPPNPRHPSPPTENRPKGLNVLGTMAHHPALAQAYFTFNGHILLATTLTERQRELIILRVAAVRKSGYEWAQHLFVARDVGLTDEEIGRIGYGPDAPFWSELDAATLRAVDELVEDARISQPTWETLVQHFDTQQVLDLICTVSAYDTLARIFNSLELDVDDDITELMGRYHELF